MNSLSATDSYLSVLLALPNLQPTTVLSLFFLTLGRILPIIALAPFLGAKNLPMTIRMMFGLSLVALFLPQNLFAAKAELPFNTTFIFLMIKELLIGCVIGMFASIPFYIAQVAGSLIDHQRGAAALQVTDPTTQTQTGPIGQLYNFVLIAIFFSLGGPFIFLEGVATSYQLIPVDGLISPTLFTWDTPLAKSIKTLFSSVMNLSIQLAAPAFIGILLTDMFLGIANRLAPQVQIVFLGMSLKSWVGIALLTAAWALIIRVMGQEAISWIKSINLLIQQVGNFYMSKS